MRLLVLVASGPGHPGARLATALVASSRSAFEDVTVFFHGEGAGHAMPGAVPGDEWSACDRWRDLTGEIGAALWVCPTSWARRAGESSPPGEFELRGLGDFSLRLADVDRVVRL